jgi:UDP-N-acetylmuramate--alanine ligase
MGEEINRQQIFPEKGSLVYFVGIKGTGVCALAELMLNSGYRISGSDTPEEFYTDKILKELKIDYFEGFNADHINEEIKMVIHSAAYSPETNPELKKALELNLPVMKYPEALGAWSARFDSAGICGVHGKTTTTAICGVLMRAAGLPAQILTGSAALDFGGRSTLHLGDKYFIAETCEYRRHFLYFHPRHIILTSVESDHQDFYPDYNSIRDAFVDYCRLLPDDGHLIYCADDPGAGEVVDILKKENRRINFIPYGFTCQGDYKVTSCAAKNERTVFSLSGFDGEFKLKIPGYHQVLNSAAAIALTGVLAGKPLGEDKLRSMKDALLNFKSTKRRSELVGEAQGIIFMDDYAHHPTAIKTTLSGIKSFFPSRRIVVSFMSHTYTRTSALLDDFARSFSDADILFLHKIYASARENNTDGISGRTLYEKTAAVRGVEKETLYADEPNGAFDPLCKILKSGDIFITVGAGSNWTLGEKLFTHFKNIDPSEFYHG